MNLGHDYFPEGHGIRRLVELLNAILSSPRQEPPREKWRSFLCEIFQPLEVITLPEEANPAVRLGHDSVEIDIPYVVGSGALRMRFAHRGKGMFSTRDAVLVVETVTMAREVLFLRRESEEVRSGERRRIARELHDHLGAALMPSLRSDDAGVQQVARGITSELRAIIGRLNSKATRLADEVPAWRAKFQQQCAACGVTFDWRDQSVPLKAPLAASDVYNLFGIVQEAVTNALRHGRPRNLTVSMNLRGSDLTVIVVDDGSGFDAARIPGGFGMQSMQARAAEMGGSVSWDVLHPHGCKVTAVVPVELMAKSEPACVPGGNDFAECSRVSASHPTAPPTATRPKHSMNRRSVPRPAHNTFAAGAHRAVARTAIGRKDE